MENLAVWWSFLETAKLKSVNIFLFVYIMRKVILYLITKFRSSNTSTVQYNSDFGLMVATTTLSIVSPIVIRTCATALYYKFFFTKKHVSRNAWYRAKKKQNKQE